MNVLELFAGIGGLSLGLERAGLHVVGQVEIDPWCRRVLAKHWPEVPRHDDVRTALEWWRSERRPQVDVIAGGYPCQPESLAGRRAGTEDARWLWPEFAAIVARLRPRFVLGENVMGHRTRGLRFVLADLHRLGYAARAGIVAASEMGAPHQRKRIFVIAADAERPELRQQPGRGGRTDWQGSALAGVNGESGNVADASGKGWGSGRGERAMEDGQSAGEPGQSGAEPVGRGWWTIEPGMGRVAHGISGRVDRLRGLGNAVVPQVAEYVARLMLSGEWLD